MSVRTVLAEVTDRLAAEFHASDRVLVEAAVRVAHIRLRDHLNWGHAVESAARARLQAIAIAA